MFQFMLTSDAQLPSFQIHHANTVGSTLSTVTMNLFSYAGKLSFLDGRREKMKMGSKIANLFSWSRELWELLTLK